MAWRGEGKSCLVTGGSGFVGKALCRELKARGSRVISVSRRDVPELREIGVDVQQVDLTRPQRPLLELLEGVHAVFHTAAHVSMWGHFDEFYRGNVVATRSLVEAASKAGVRNFIYTSSPSVIADGSNLRGIDETRPYPQRYSAFYPMTKAVAEQEVLATHGREGLLTVALRPHLIFGPGDTNLIPTIVERAKEGRLVRIGRGDNLADFSFISDCVGAHITALEALERDPSCGGQAYFISQGDPFPLWRFIDLVLQYSGISPIQRRVPKSVAMAVAGLCELSSKIRPGNPEPLLTRFLVSEMATDHYFSIENARRSLGYHPTLSVEEALAKTFGYDYPKNEKIAV